MGWSCSGHHSSSFQVRSSLLEQLQCPTTRSTLIFLSPGFSHRCKLVSSPVMQKDHKSKHRRKLAPEHTGWTPNSWGMYRGILQNLMKVQNEAFISAGTSASEWWENHLLPREITLVACKYSPHLVMNIATYVSGPFLGHLPLGHNIKKAQARFWNLSEGQ